MRKFLKKFFLIVLIVLLLIQIPFIYRRYQNGKLAEKINQLQSQRTVQPDPNYTEYKGIIHAHTSLGGHSTGTFDELIDGANANDLDFVIMTEHYTDKYDTSALTLNGVYGKTLFVGGNEIDTSDGDRFLMIPGGPDAASFSKMPTNVVLSTLHSENRLAFITYPEKFKSWNSDFDGDEVFSLHTNAKKMNPFLALFDLIWSYPAYPALTFATYFKRPDENLAKFDEIAAKRKVVFTAGTDAHSNIGFHLLGDDAGNKFINIKIDPYKTTFQLVRVHVLIDKNKPLTRESLIDALKMGHSFIGFDVLGDTSGFNFLAENDVETKIMGDDIALSQGVRLRVVSPIPARCVIFRNGEKYFESQETGEISLDAKESGTYRVELYLDQLGSPFDKMPWIISDPIYVK
jgi:hypothetical protein